MKALCWHGPGKVEVDDVPDPVVLNPRDAIQACRKGGTVSIPGVYGGVIDKLNIGAAFAKGAHLPHGAGRTRTAASGPCWSGCKTADPSFAITHSFSLEDAPDAYRIFRDKQDECIKVVLTP